VDYAASKGAIDTMTIGLVQGTGGRRHPRQLRAARLREHGDPRRRRRTQPHRAPARRHPDEARRRAEEVARAILWLLSDEASYSTGAIWM
jgi:NAD(P)-dependent dehydrogenase (short-subunit alcohol dehydrogenase family)